MAFSEWFLWSDECHAAHPEPGSCVPHGGEYVLAGILLFVVVMVAYAWWKFRGA